MRTRWIMAAGVLAGSALFLAGCLERKETIHVAPDGSVAMHVNLSGDPGDFDAGDALPSRESGWQIEMRREKDANDKEQQILETTREFGHSQELPDAYVEQNDERYDASLHFPTAVTIERRRDGVYYHFKRTYKAREQARYNAVREQNPELFAEIEGFGGKDPAELTVEQRSKIVEALRKTEAAKQVEYLLAGVEAMKDRWPQHFGLLVRQTLLDEYKKLDPRRVADLLAEPASESRDAEINETGQRVLVAGREAVHRMLRNLDVPSREIDQFFAAADREEKRRIVSEDIGDERWTVRVQMPGEIIASNATSLDNGVAEWAFDGKLMYDRDQVLMVTSRVDRRRDTEHQDAEMQDGQ
ncbi:MAG: hypothetical protein HZB38_01475 [Planctomycetes bacterium]|nr:hypothetical protein [Planctomycetota bacterium]